MRQLLLLSLCDGVLRGLCAKAAVLLDIHNIHFYCNFFAEVRSAVGAGKFGEFAAFHRNRAAAGGA